MSRSATPALVALLLLTTSAQAQQPQSPAAPSPLIANSVTQGVAAPTVADDDDDGDDEAKPAAAAAPPPFSLPPSANGIEVFEPKLYDDRSLQQLLRTLSTRLSVLTGVDQAALTSRLGSVQGSSSSQMLASVSAAAMPIPGVQTTSLTGSPSVQQTNSLQTVGAPTGVTTTANNQTLTTQAANTVQTVASAPTITPGASALPTYGAPAMPTAYNVSSIDALNEEMQLSSAIIGLQLLLQGPLGDEYTPAGQGRHHVTLGFPINIETPTRYKNAVADVEISVCNSAKVRGPDAEALVEPSLQNILPQEKSYNVASLSSKAFGFGAGAVISSVVNVGGNFLFGRQTYYLVRDQDTVAMRRRGPVTPVSCAPAKARPLTFAWQFRPVLGRATVQQGMRQTFAQISLPPQKGRVTVMMQACWRRYDRKSGIAGEVIANSCAWSTPIVSSVQTEFDTTAIDGILVNDRNDGTLSTRVSGRYLPGTQVAIGDTLLGEGTPGFVNTGRYISFTAGTQILALRGARLASPDGAVKAIALPPERSLRSCWHDQASLLQARDAVDLAVYNDSQVQVSFPLSCAGNEAWRSYLRNHPYVVELNGRAFGLSDAPFRTNTSTRAAFLAPKSLLQGNFRFGLKLLYSTLDAVSYTTDPWDPTTITGVVLLSTGSDGQTTYALTGAQLSELEVMMPAGIKLKKKAATLSVFTLTSDQIKATKQLVLKPKIGPPILITLPDGGAPKEAKAKLSPHAPVGQSSTGGFTIGGTSLNQIASIAYLGKPLPFAVSADGKSATLAALPADALAVVGTVRLQVTLSDGTTQDYAFAVTP